MKVAVMTVDTKEFLNQTEGSQEEQIRKILENQGCQLVFQRTLPQDLTVLRQVLERIEEQKAAELIFTIGATGVAGDDCAPDALEAVAEISLPGMGEALRAKMVQENPNAVLSRATAGIKNGTVLINLPRGNALSASCLEYILPQAMAAARQLHGLEESDV